MIWALGLDDFSGTLCNNGRYPLLSTIYNCLAGSTQPSTSSTTKGSTDVTVTGQTTKPTTATTSTHQTHATTSSTCTGEETFISNISCETSCLST